MRKGKELLLTLRKDYEPLMPDGWKAAPGDAKVLYLEQNDTDLSPRTLRTSLSKFIPVICCFTAL
jgi:hypothetical protein